MFYIALQLLQDGSKSNFCLLNFIFTYFSNPSYMYTALDTSWSLNTGLPCPSSARCWYESNNDVWSLLNFSKQYVATTIPGWYCSILYKIDYTSHTVQHSYLSEWIPVLTITIIIGWKPIIIVWTFWAEKSIFPEKVRQNAADPDQIRYTWTCQGVTTFREFWARSAHFGQNGSSDESRGTRGFICLVNHPTFRQLCNGRFSPNMVTKRISVSRRGIRKDNF